MESSPTRPDKMATEPHQRLGKVNEYFTDNLLFYWLVGGSRFAILRFASILFAGYVIAYFVTWYEHTHRIGPDVTRYDIANLEAFSAALLYPSNKVAALSQFIVASNLASNTRLTLTNYSKGDKSLAVTLQTQLATELTTLLTNSTSLYESNRFPQGLRGQAQILLRQKDLKLTSSDFKRALLDNAYCDCGFKKRAIGLFDDWVAIALFPALIIGVYNVRRLVARVEELCDTFETMLDAAKRRPHAEPTNQICTRIRRTIALRTAKAKAWHWGLTGLCFFFVLLLQVIFPLLHLETPTWVIQPYRFPFGFGFGVLWAIFWWCLIAGNMIWYVVATGVAVFPVVKQYADRDELCIVPNAPDGQGGLAPVGAVAFAMSSVLGTGMVIVVVWILRFGIDPAIVVGGGLYTAAVLLSLFLPLWSTHDAMRRAKRRELRRVATLFRREYDSLPRSEDKPAGDGATGGGENLAARLDMMAKLEGIYATVRAMPVWPFDMTTLSRFALLLVSPLLSWLIHQAAGEHLAKSAEGILDWLAKGK